MSFNWFTKSLSAGDGKLRTIQQQLNTDWSDIIGVQACDGVMSRNTPLSLLGALQAALGIRKDYIFNFNELNFGPKTKSTFIEKFKFLMRGENNSQRVLLNDMYPLYWTNQ